MDIEERINSIAIAAEHNLSGCILVYPSETIRDVRSIVSADDFYNEHARAIFVAASVLIAAGKACDPVLIQEETERQGKKVDAEYCKTAMQSFVTMANAAETARVIHDQAQQRRWHQIGVDLADGQIDGMEAVRKLQDVIRGDSTGVKEPMEDANSFMDYINAVAAGTARTYLSTGFRSLDEQLSGGSKKGGLVNSGFITFAARPGTGKSTIALCIGDNVAARGEKVLYVSLEMTKDQLWACRMANYTGLNRAKIYDGMDGADDKEWRLLTDAFQVLSQRPFYIRDIPSTLADIEREARCLEGLSLLIVDHIGLVKPAVNGARYDEMTQVSHGLKQLALSLKIPIIGLCQLNRKSEERGDKKPTMADLRDSGAIEEDSDVVALLFRPAKYAKDEDKPKPWETQELQVIVDKNRHGSTDIVYLDYCGMNSRVLEGHHARDHQLPY